MFGFKLINVYRDYNYDENSVKEEEDKPDKFYLYNYEADAIEQFLLLVKKRVALFIGQTSISPNSDKTPYPYDGSYWSSITFTNKNKEVFCEISCFINFPSNWSHIKFAAINAVEEKIDEFDAFSKRSFASFEEMKKEFILIQNQKKTGRQTDTFKSTVFDFEFLDSENLILNESMT